jgi:hypothetical protein
MIVYRAVALAAAACLTGLPLAACSAGLTSAAPPAASAPPASTPSATPTGSPVSASGSTVSVDAPIGSFPVPPGATVVANVIDNGKVEIVLTGVSAQEASTFYTAALPAAGYTITSNATVTGTTFSAAAAIKFTGHRYSGDIGAVSGINVPGVTGLTGNDVGIQLTPQ